MQAGVEHVRKMAKLGLRNQAEWDALRLSGGFVWQIPAARPSSCRSQNQQELQANFSVCITVESLLSGRRCHPFPPRFPTKPLQQTRGQRRNDDVSAQRPMSAPRLVLTFSCRRRSLAIWSALPSMRAVMTSHSRSRSARRRASRVSWSC